MKKILILLLACFLSAASVSAQSALISHNSNLRSGPSPSSRNIRLLPAGAAITVISRYPRLGYVRVQEAKDGETGWVWERNVTGGKAQESILSPPLDVLPKEVPGHKVGEPGVYPILQLTPGREDPTVTQSNLAKNICNKAWTTDSVRPATSVTSKIKHDTMKDYGFTDAANHYELDHLLSLQNGGCPDCKENLWPEAYGDQRHPMTQIQRSAWNKKNPGSAEILAGALEKDLVENHIHDEICIGFPSAKMSSYAKRYPALVSITLRRGQEILATDWYACYLNIMNGNQPCE